MTDTQARRKPNWKLILSTGLFLLLIGLLAAYVHAHWDEMQKLLTLPSHVFWQLIVRGVLSAFINGLYHLTILRTYKLKLSLTDWMGVVSVSNTIAYVLPMRMDLLFSATYYKRVKGLAYTKSVSISAGNIIFGVTFSLLQILIALVCIGLIEGQWPATLWLLLLAGMAGMAVFLWLSLRAESSLREKLVKHKAFGDILTGFNALLRNRDMLWRLLLCMIASNLVKLYSMVLCFQAVGVPITVYEALFYSSVSWMSSIVAIVPGNIGLKESVMGVATLMLGSMFSEGVAASLLDRGTIMMVYIALGLIFSIPVLRNLNRNKPAAGVQAAMAGAPLDSQSAEVAALPAEPACAAEAEPPPQG
ncbi:MAG: lysylphosphatidylglycerol synthase transmembrane domain-containing protein [Candidatus Limiplasma sp.]|nr:lysylphosphatidylglycerol synthase transmembrane domain-containing protein [Candidatus Limiplasma sp.]MEA5145578.1 lysylphosphatidylglycerol synthase transmembrane domain-containing protein [Candidatus Limiplasma sp.]